jgi:PAS domain S-box-containing protein
MELPALLGNLWRDMLCAYLDNPLPELYKERLFAYLSRYCEASYCIVCHSCALRPLGMSGAEVLELLESPPVAAEPDPLVTLRAVQRFDGWPEPGSPLDAALFCSAVALHLKLPAAPVLRSELRRLLGPDYQQLVVFLSYVRACHAWVEGHPELRHDADARAQRHLAPLLEERPELGTFFADYRKRVRNFANDEHGDEKVLELGAIVMSSDDAIIGKDLDGTIMSWNRGAARIYGYRSDEVVGRRISVLIPPERAGDLAEILESVRRGQSIDHYETVRVRKDGTHIDVSLTVSPIMDARGRLVGASTIARDVTEQKRVEQELRRSNEDLERFAYIASHDLSVPLRVIAGFVDLLARRYAGRLDEEADRFIRLTVEGVERMQTLIDDILAYSRAGQAELRLAEVDTAALVDGVLRDLGTRIAESGTRFEVGELPTLRAEPVRLRQVFQNLIDNAVKFADPKSPRGRIVATRGRDHWRFDVEDNGPGVDLRHAERVFEMFQRPHGRDVPGTGIGLAIAKRIVERHGGSIWVEQASGGGSVFSFTIPLHLGEHGG